MYSEDTSIRRLSLVASDASWRIVLAPLGVVTLVVGLVLTLRGRSLGSIITIPGFIGFAILFFLVLLLLPIRMTYQRDGV